MLEGNCQAFRIYTNRKERQAPIIYGLATIDNFTFLSPGWEYLYFNRDFSKMPDSLGYEIVKANKYIKDMTV
jgi:hypothetical protein